MTLFQTRIFDPSLSCLGNAACPGCTRRRIGCIQQSKVASHVTQSESASLPLQAFAAAVLRNPVLDLSAMIHLSDIPDWCYIEAYGTEARPQAVHIAAVSFDAAWLSCAITSACICAAFACLTSADRASVSIR
jgi:hypothetical protein